MYVTEVLNIIIIKMLLLCLLFIPILGVTAITLFGGDVERLQGLHSLRASPDGLDSLTTNPDGVHSLTSDTGSICYTKLMGLMSSTLNFLVALHI